MTLAIGGRLGVDPGRLKTIEKAIGALEELPNGSVSER